MLVNDTRMIAQLIAGVSRGAYPVSAGIRLQDRLEEIAHSPQPIQRMAIPGQNGGSSLTIPPSLMRTLEPKKKRKVSKYQRALGKNLKALKRKHPRTPTSKLMKRAHSMTKKQMRK